MKVLDGVKNSIVDWLHPTIPVDVYAHLPGMFYSPKKNKIMSENLSRGLLEIKPELIEIISLRDTSETPCDEDTIHYDQSLLLDILTAFDCKPKYLNSNNLLPNFPVCQSKRKLEQLDELLLITQSLPSYEKYR